jgi:hypothetical protein
MHEAFDEYPVNSGNYMYIYHLQGPDARGFISAVFLSISVLEHRLALSTAFSTEMGHFAPLQTAKSFLHLIHITGIPQGLPESNDGSVPLAFKSRVALATPAPVGTRSLAATQKPQEP